MNEFLAEVVFGSMVAAMATFEGTATGPADTARLVGKDLVPWLREYDGFRGVLVLTGEEKHGVITLWDTPEDEASTRPARLAMHDTVSAAVGMSLVDYEVFDLPVLEVVDGPSGIAETKQGIHRGLPAVAGRRLPAARAPVPPSDHGNPA